MVQAINLIPLTEFFNKIIGIDFSSSQIKNAVQHSKFIYFYPLENITYLQGSSENTNLENESIDVITVATGFHWFDIPKALKEMNRILKPNGTIAIWTYMNSQLKMRKKQMSYVSNL